MPLTGVRVLFDDGEKPQLQFEARLQNGQAKITQGAGAPLATLLEREGIPILVASEAGLAADLGKKFGVEMPREPRTYRLRHGRPFLVAVLARFASGSRVWAEPVED